MSMRKFIFQIPVDSSSLDEICRDVINGRRVFNVFLNIRKINLLYNDKGVFADILSDKDSVFSVDGKWIKWLANLNGMNIRKCFGGLHVIEKFFSVSADNNLRIYLLGAREEVLEEAEAKLRARFPMAIIAGRHNGFFKDKEEVVEGIIKSQAEILFIALPSPQKELFGYDIFKKVQNLRYVAGVGGAFNIIAGKTNRAPVFMQTAGLEWFYRCLQEPAIMFKRYYIDGVDFFRIILKEMHNNIFKRKPNAQD